MQNLAIFERYQPGDRYINVHVKVYSDRITIVIPIRLVALSTDIRPQFHLSNVIFYRIRVQLQRQCFLKNKSLSIVFYPSSDPTNIIH